MKSSTTSTSTTSTRRGINRGGGGGATSSPLSSRRALLLTVALVLGTVIVLVSFKMGNIVATEEGEHDGEYNRYKAKRAANAEEEGNGRFADDDVRIGGGSAKGDDRRQRDKPTPPSSGAVAFDPIDGQRIPIDGQRIAGETLSDEQQRQQIVLNQPQQQEDGHEKPPLSPPSSTTGVRRPAKIRHITVQTGETAPWCRMLLSYFLSQPIEHDGGAAATDHIGESTSNNKVTTTTTIHNIGWGRKYAHSARPAWILDWLRGEQQSQQQEEEGKGSDHSSSSSYEGLSDDDILMFADGGDTLYTGVASADIAQTFDALSPRADEVDSEGRLIMAAAAAKKTDAGYTPPPSLPGLLFNAEANCYHQQTFGGSWGPKKGRCLSAYRRYHNRIRRKLQQQQKHADSEKNKAAPPLPIPSNVRHLTSCTALDGTASKFKYLNAGAWIGRVWAVKRVFAAVRAIIEKDKGLWCDQSVIGGVLLKRQFSEWVMGIDTENRYFLPIYHLNEKTDFCPADFNDMDDGSPNILHDGDEAKVNEQRLGKAIRRVVDGEQKLLEGNDRLDAARVDGLVGRGDSSSQGGSGKKKKSSSYRAQRPRLLTMCHSNHTPALLHFNGKSEKMAKFLTHRTSWWQAYNLKDVREKGRVAAGVFEAGDADMMNGEGGGRKSVVESRVWHRDILLGGGDGGGSPAKVVAVMDKCPNVALPP